MVSLVETAKQKISAAYLDRVKIQCASRAGLRGQNEKSNKEYMYI